MACQLYYMVIKQAFQYKTKGIYLKMQPKEKDLFVYKWNEYVEFHLTSVANTCMFNKRMLNLKLHTGIFSVI